MNRYIWGVLSLAALLSVVPAISYAEDTPPAGVPVIATGEAGAGAAMMGGTHEEHMRHRTPEEREKHRAMMKEKFDKLPPEKQAEIRAKMQERREKIKNMTPEERKAFRKEWP